MGSFRKRTRPKKDKKVFNKTASNTKKINLVPQVRRGGIRL